MCLGTTAMRNCATASMEVLLGLVPLHVIIKKDDLTGHISILDGLHEGVQSLNKATYNMMRGMKR